MDEEIKILRNCEICRSDKIEQVELDYLSENITGKEACEILQCSMYQFKNHIEKHLKRDIAGQLSSNAPVLAKKIFDKTNELIESCDRILATIGEVQNEWRNKKKPEWVSAFVKLETVLSGNIEKLQKIQGEFRESSTVRIENLNMQVNNMTQELIEGMCPRCKQELAPKILKIVNPNAPTRETETKM